jgi:hypothetical protein
MTVAEIVRAEIAKFLKSGDAPVPPKPAKPASDELREKRLKALEKAREAKKAKSKAAKPAAKAAPAKKPARVNAEAETFGTVVSEPYTSAKGTKSLLLGVTGKQGRLVFHSKAELVAWVNVIRSKSIEDIVAQAELHIG